MAGGAIETDGLGKRYLLGATRGQYDTLREAISRASSRRFRAQRQADQFWALRDVSIAVEAGESVGLIGPNGAGKTTLLRLLARITEPTVGVSRTRGRVGSLLEVGSGFHRELTGRDNVYLNGAVLGMSRRDTKRRFDDIVDFAGVEEFLDTPLKRYSAGMQLRLAFSVAAHLEPDIVLVDEVLAVGDLDFQQRCLTRMSELGREGRTVVFVSHDLGSVRRLCSRTIWIDSAEVRADGASHDVIGQYIARHGESSYSVALPARPGQAIDVQWVGVTDAGGTPGEPLSGESFFVRAHLGVRKGIRDLDAALYINNPEGVRVVDEAWSETGGALLLGGSLQPREIFIEVPGALVPGEYFIGVWVSSEDECFFFDEVMAFRVQPQPTDKRASLDKTRILACRGGLQTRVLE